MRAKYLVYGLVVCAIGAGAWLRGHPDAHSTANANRGAGHEGQRRAGPASAVEAPGMATPSANGAESSLSKYQLAFAAPSLDVLTKLERTANESHDAVLLARVFLERSRVLHAAAGLPPIEPNGQKGRSDP